MNICCLIQLAERFRLPVVTLVDTVGAWPTFECERDGQSEAIATNLTVMAGLKVPIVTIVTGEGGSGGALGIGMGNVVGMLSGGYFGVISPEGAASILGRYKVTERLTYPILNHMISYSIHHLIMCTLPLPRSSFLFFPGRRAQGEAVSFGLPGAGHRPVHLRVPAQGHRGGRRDHLGEGRRGSR